MLEEVGGETFHGLVELVQREFLSLRYAIAFLPRFRRTVAAGSKEPVDLLYSPEFLRSSRPPFAHEDQFLGGQFCNPPA